MNSDRPDKTSNPDINELTQQYRAGATLSQLAKAAGVAVSAVRKRLFAAGVTLRSRGQRAALNHPGGIPGLQEVLTRYANGEACAALAKEFGISVGTVYNALHKAGVPVRERGRPQGSESERKLTFAQRKELLADLRAAKHPTLTEIAEKYGISREMARQYAEKAGIIYYRKKERTARTSWAIAQRKAAKRELKKIEDAARAAQVDAIEALWLAKASDEEISLKTGVHCTRSKIAWLRRCNPGRFPHRHPNASKEAIAKNAPARAAKAAAIAQEKEARRKKIQLLEALWDAGASMMEISRQTGYVRPANIVKLLRERHPGRFLPRDTTEIKGTKK